MFEASMNFDLENVESFLIRIDTRLGLNLPLEELVELTHETEIGTEQSRTINVDFGDSQTTIEYRVFMDDIDAPDLYFFTPTKNLAESIKSEMETFADELGI